MLACALDLLLMNYCALQVSSPGYLAVGALALWLTGRVAVRGSVLRVAPVPPEVATRSV